MWLEGHLPGWDQCQLRHYKKLNKKLQKNIQDLYFLKNCRDLGVIPRFLQIKTHALDYQDFRVIQIAQLKRLKVIIRQKRKIINQLNLKTFLAYNVLASSHREAPFGDLVFDSILHVVHRCLEKENEKTVSTHQRKLQILQRQQHNNQGINHDTTYQRKYTFYQNKSSLNIGPELDRILQQGPKFAYPQVFVRSEQYIPKYEDIIHRVHDNQNFLRHKISKCIEKQIVNQKYNRRLQYDRKTLLNLRNNQDIIVTTADKTDQVVILNRNDYCSKMSQTFHDMKLKKRNIDPTNRVKVDMARFKNHKLNLPEEIQRTCYPPIGARVPHIYGKIKLHKEGEPARPIVSKCIAPTYNFEKGLYNYLAKYIPMGRYSVKNTVDFIARLKDFSDFHRPFCMVTCDIVSLFPNVPVPEAISEIQHRLTQCSLKPDVIDDITDSLNFINNNNFFVFDEVIYQQLAGAPMGSPLSGLLAEVILDTIEVDILNNTDDYRPLIYIRYVDDIFMLWPHSQDNLQSFVNKFSYRFPSIQLKYEIENDCTVNYLDLTIKRCKNSFDLTVYRKPTHVPSIIPNISCHPWTQKMSGFYSLIKRAYTHCSSEIAFNKEITYIKKLANDFGYRISAITNVMNNVMRSHCTKINSGVIGESANKPTFIGSLDYNPETCFIMKKFLKKQNLDIGTKTQNIKGLVINNKDPVPLMRRSGVYSIPIVNSNDGQITSAYIGSTKRNFGVRFKEHIKNWRDRDEKTALIKYCCENQCYPDFKNASHLQTHNSVKKIHLAESILIQKGGSGICNDSQPLHIPSDWSHLIGKEIN